MTTDTGVIAETIGQIEDDEFAGYDDYWGTEVQERHYLPDKKQYFVIQVMNEGQRARFQTENNSDLTVKRDGDAKIKVEPAKERHALLKAAVVGCHIVRRDPATNKFKKVEFDRNFMLNWLSEAPVQQVDDLEHAIRKFNPWLQGDMAVEDIDKEIARLQELRVDVEKREQGK